MSKDIWHNTDEKPEPFKTFVFKTDKGNTCSDMLSTNSGWNNILLPEFYSMDDFDKAERITKWCYLDDLLALENELERTRKALGYAIDVIQTVAKMSDKLSRKYGDTLVEQLDTIQAFCWEQGYILTHDEDFKRAEQINQKEQQCGGK